MKLRTLLLLVLLGCFFSTSNVSAQANGQELFETMNCVKCHDPEYNKLGPPLKVIASAFEKDEKLLSYFNGETDPIVKPKMAKIMEGSLRKIIELNDQEKVALASFIMKHK